jgi:hypothetical protein
MKRPTAAQASLLGLKPSELAVIDEHDLLAPEVTFRSAPDRANADGLASPGRSLHDWRRAGIIAAAVATTGGLALIWLLWMLVGR